MGSSTLTVSVTVTLPRKSPTATFDGGFVDGTFKVTKHTKEFIEFVQSILPQARKRLNIIQGVEQTNIPAKIITRVIA